MVRARAVAICVALLAFAPQVRAQPHVVERLRLQGGTITEQRPAPAERVSDIWIGAVPELSATWLRRRASVNITYSITGALHSLRSASEIANRAVLTSAYELTPRTALLLSIEGAQTSTSNFLIQRPAGEAGVALYPAAGTKFVIGRASQYLRHELSPVLVVSQDASALTTTTLAPAPPLDTFVASVGGGIERLWRNDAVGVSLHGGYALTRATPPTPSAEVFTATLEPTWRHDWTRSISTAAGAGATYVFSPDPGREDVLAPSGHASILFTAPPTSVDLNYTVGVFPSPLTGQILRSQRVLLHAMTPISEHHRVMLGASLGYLRATLLDLAVSANDQSFHAFSSDIDVTWQATARMQVFGRYQTIAQLADITAAGVNPSFLRDAVLVGVQLSSDPVQLTVPTRFGQRVDGSDAPLRPSQQREQQRVIEGAVEGAPPDAEREEEEESEEEEGVPRMWRRRPPPRPAVPQPAPQQRPGQQRRPPGSPDSMSPGPAGPERR